MRKFLFIVVATALLFSCGEESAMQVVEVTDLRTLASGEPIENCTNDNAGTMVYLTDSTKIYYCSKGKWQTLNGKNGPINQIVQKIDTITTNDTTCQNNSTVNTEKILPTADSSIKLLKDSIQAASIPDTAKANNTSAEKPSVIEVQNQQPQQNAAVTEVPSQPAPVASTTPVDTTAQPQAPIAAQDAKAPVQTPETPAAPDVQAPVQAPETPAAPDVQAPVQAPETPAAPDVQAPVQAPETPAAPDVQAPVQAPETPAAPAAPATQAPAPATQATP